MLLHFREGVLLYSLTGCRLAFTALSGGPHCSYKTIKDFLTERKLEINGDVVAAFDNSKVPHRASNVSVDGKFRCHIVTMATVF